MDNQRPNTEASGAPGHSSLRKRTPEDDDEPSSNTTDVPFVDSSAMDIDRARRSPSLSPPTSPRESAEEPSSTSPDVPMPDSPRSPPATPRLSPAVLPAQPATSAPQSPTKRRKLDSYEQEYGQSSAEDSPSEGTTGQDNIQPEENEEERRHNADSNGSSAHPEKDTGGWEDFLMGLTSIIIVGRMPSSREVTISALKKAGLENNLCRAEAIWIAALKIELIQGGYGLSRLWVMAMNCGTYKGVAAQVINEAVRRCLNEWDMGMRPKDCRDIASGFLQKTENADGGARRDMLHCLAGEGQPRLDMDQMDDNDADNTILYWVADTLGMRILPESWFYGDGSIKPYTWDILVDWIVSIRENAGSNRALISKMDGIVGACKERSIFEAELKKNRGMDPATSPPSKSSDTRGASPLVIRQRRERENQRPGSSTGQWPKPNPVPKGVKLTAESVWGPSPGRGSPDRSLENDVPSSPASPRPRKSSITQLPGWYLDHSLPLVDETYSPSLDEFPMIRYSAE